MIRNPELKELPGWLIQQLTGGIRTRLFPSLLFSAALNIDHALQGPQMAAQIQSSHPTGTKYSPR